MLSYNDKRWQSLKGGYGHFYNPVPALQKLENGLEIKLAWDELFEELHHQGDIGDAAYAVLPHLVQIYSQNRHPTHQMYLYGLACIIEIERHRQTNPAVPEWLVASYLEAWSKLFQLALEDIQTNSPLLTDPNYFQQLLATLTLAKGHLQLGTMISFTSNNEVAEYLEKQWAWSKLYNS